MMNPTLITRRRLLIAMALSPLLWQMRGAQAADVDPQRVVALEWLPAELLLALGVLRRSSPAEPDVRRTLVEQIQCLVRQKAVG